MKTLFSSMEFLFSVVFLFKLLLALFLITAVVVFPNSSKIGHNGAMTEGTAEK